MKILGIDTGGTYTDGAIIDRDQNCVLKTAKALTTPWDLTEGLNNCIGHFSDADLRSVDMVCLSTTLATNAILEGRGCKAGLILMGSVPEGRLPADSYEYLPARIDIRGGIQNSLLPEQADEVLERLRGKCDALAISGYSSVRNPVHEEQMRRMAREKLGIPVVCAHELTGQLGFYERTVTAVLNARLIPIIDGLLRAVNVIFREREVSVPIMVVRGDGSLMQEAYALERPVETVLSGPAASMLGSLFLSGRSDGLVADMGGTSLDIVSIRNGEAAVSEEGAEVAGWKTRVRALNIRTYAIGGDSHITVKDRKQFFIGPRKVVPYCRSEYISGKTGVTPTDIVHITGEYVMWDRKRSGEGAAALAEKAGIPVSKLAGLLSEKIAERTAFCLKESMQHFDLPANPVIIGAGAPADVWLRKAAAIIGAEIIVPAHADVANAVGAAAGKIIELSAARVRFDRRTDSYSIFSELENEKEKDFEKAKNRAETIVQEQAARKAVQAGARSFEIAVFHQEVSDSTGQFIEYVVKAAASGMP